MRSNDMCDREGGGKLDVCMADDDDGMYLCAVCVRETPAIKRVSVSARCKLFADSIGLCVWIYCYP